MNFKGDPTSSDFKNIFIGANNSKRTNLNLIDNKRDFINSHLLSSVINDRLKEYREAKKQLPF
ncbi:hypothetical protein [Helicobacter pylori]|uniref:hypothetical protein n=1 Tax=Helicobacter pylori TaxID=210 RepID=UPI00073D3EE5|nr:hypothetical protein [Helicobacter pylori]OKA00627.1 hypothetical protein AP072_0205765 [Helicobacter pylori]OKA02180.1 hypothetical protein AV922_0204505 [Helicobacter pylori]OMQ17374.1 hypothetical protein BLW89_06200 [Helicobacter pylori]OMQ18825.1 hypothetical protein BLW90_02995 [Helicobacter pylori]